MQRPTLGTRLSREKVAQCPHRTTQGPLYTVSKGILTQHEFTQMPWRTQEPPACTHEERAHVRECKNIREPCS